MSAVLDLLRWSLWRPLKTASTDPDIPRTPGLYQVRRVGRSDVDYIGQTGMRLGKRLAMLRGVYAEEMPYRDPHTAAPALWALRHATDCDFEVSVTSVEGSIPWRKGLEALAVSLYRQEHGCSPTVEFGRVPKGYRASSPNNSRLVRAGKRFRGGPAPGVVLENHTPGIPPMGKLGGDSHGISWNGHSWSAWTPLTVKLRGQISRCSGLYRIRGDDSSSLLYIGEGKIPDRPLAHLAKVRISNHVQGLVFGSQSRLECSWVMNDDWLSHQRLELENDLIAAHLLTTDQIPTAQFLG